MDALSVFSRETRGWFERTFERPTPAQALGWPAIASGKHTLIQAPTGSGKTLAAFLYGIDRLTAEGAKLRRRADPARAAGRPPLRPTRRRSHRRHASEGAAGDAAAPAGHPDHDAGVAVPDHDLARARGDERG